MQAPLSQIRLWDTEDDVMVNYFSDLDVFLLPNGEIVLPELETGYDDYNRMSVSLELKQTKRYIIMRGLNLFDQKGNHVFEDDVVQGLYNARETFRGRVVYDCGGLFLLVNGKENRPLYMMRSINVLGNVHKDKFLLSPPSV